MVVVVVVSGMQLKIPVMSEDRDKTRQRTQAAGHFRACFVDNEFDTVCSFKVTPAVVSPSMRPVISVEVQEP